MCDVCSNLKGKAVLNKDLYYNLLDEVMLTKANTNTPTFKVDKDMGEGTATKQELQYRQKIQNLIKQVWKVRQEKTDKELHSLIDKLFLSDDSEGKQIATEFIDTIYTTNAELLIDKLKDEGVTTKIPEETPIKDALLEWQLFTIEKIGIELELGIRNERLAKTYFEAAYGNPDKTTNR